MKVPFGYGNCHILFDTGSQPAGGQKDLYFKIDQSSFFEIDEWSEEWVTLARSREKDIYGYHFNFDLKLMADSLQSSATQDELINFFYYYNLNQYKDKRFYIEPYRGGTNPNQLKQLFQVTAVNYPTLSNVAEASRAKGQYLHLKCRTKL